MCFLKHVMHMGLIQTTFSLMEKKIFDSFFCFAFEAISKVLNGSGSPLTFHPLAFFVSAFQKSAMKLYTCATTTTGRRGDESTSEMWSSAHAWLGKSIVKESDTHVRIT